MITGVVHVRKDPFDRYIGRRVKGFLGSEWQNPFRVKIYGLAESLRLYELRASMNCISKERCDALFRLNGVLGCWCAPKGGLTLDDPIICHGQILWKLQRELQKGDA